MPCPNNSQDTDLSHSHTRDLVCHELFVACDNSRTICHVAVVPPRRLSSSSPHSPQRLKSNQLNNKEVSSPRTAEKGGSIILDLHRFSLSLSSFRSFLFFSFHAHPQIHLFSFFFSFSFFLFFCFILHTHHYILTNNNPLCISLVIYIDNTALYIIYFCHIIPTYPSLDHHQRATSSLFILQVRNWSTTVTGGTLRHGGHPCQIYPKRKEKETGWVLVPLVTVAPPRFFLWAPCFYLATPHTSPHLTNTRKHPVPPLFCPICDTRIAVVYLPL